YFARKAGVPVAYAIASDDDCFGCAFQGAMQLDFHGSDFREREPVTVQLHPITILRIGEAVVPATSLEARIAGLLARLHAAKERLERQIDACARFLKRLRKGVIEEWLLGFPAGDQLNRIEARQRF